MGWQDSFGLLEQTLSYAPRAARPARAQTFEQRYRPGPRFDRPPSASQVNWSDLATGRLAPDRSRAPSRPAGVPERINVSLPYSSTGPGSPYAPPAPAAPISTQGDLFGSIGAAGEQLFSNLNLANVIPFFMERVNTLANDLAAADLPVVSPAAKAASHATGAFIDAVEAVSRPVGQVLDAFPSWVRDSQLEDRARLYRAIANGETVDYGPLGPVSNPIATLGQIAGFLDPSGGGAVRAASGRSLNPVADLTGQTVSEQASQAKRWQDILRQSVDPQGRLTAEQHLGILRDSIDLPESLKLQLERKPGASDDEVKQWLNEAPEGRQWSYRDDPSGIFQNMATSAVFFIAEAQAGYGLGKGIGAFGSAAGGQIGQVIGGAGQAVSVTAKLQTAAVAAGVGITAVQTTMGALARHAGAEEAIAWFDHANRSTEFSDDPMVQLATSFAVNPFAAVKGAVKGVVTLKHGLIDVPLNVVTGNRLNRIMTSDDVIEDMTRRMFKLGSRAEAATFLDEQGLRASAPDRILGTALDLVLDRLPKVERQSWNAMHSDPVERASATLTRYGKQALDLIEKDPDLVAARFYQYDWNYRMMPGPFEPSLAAKIALDHRAAVEMTYDLRRGQNLVVGYREFLPPKGQALARDIVEQATVDGQVPMRTLQELVVDFPALRKEWGGLVKSTDATIPRAVVDQIIDNAHISWSRAAKVNPVRVATGVDPVIRPHSPTLERDYADAIGTNVDTIRAISDFDAKSAQHADLLRKLLVDKTDLDPAAAAALSPEEAFARAADYLETTTKPWVEGGARVEGAETQMTRLRQELVRVKREGTSSEHDRTVRIQREINELADLVRTAGDPIETFASGTPRRAGLGDSHLAALATRKVDAIERLRVVETVDNELAAGGITEKVLDLVTIGPDGELLWAYDLLGAPPKEVLDAFLAYRTANMYVVRNVAGELTRRRQTIRELGNKGQEYVRDVEAAPGSYQWAEIVKSPGFIRRMREQGDEVFGETYATFTDAPSPGITGNAIADLLESTGLARGVSGRGIDEIAEAWGVDRAGALRKIADLKRARSEALDGKGVAAMKRTAGIKVSDDYVAQAEADRAARELVYDAEYDAFWHPRNIAKVQEITGNADELWPGLRAVVEGDAALEEGIAKIAAEAGITPDDVLSNKAHAAAVRAELVPADFEAPVEGLIREWTDLDYLITAGDADGIAALSEQLAQQRATPRPPVRVTEKVAKGLAQMPKSRRSYSYRRQISDRDGSFKAPPNEAIMAETSNRTGLEVLSVMNHGITGTKPATIDGVIALLRDIENGAATRMGIGPELQAEAQRVARALLDDAVKASKRSPDSVGTFGAGFFPEDEMALAATLDDLLTFDDANPLGTLQYGLKKAPKDAVVMEWSKVPGLAEELLSKRFLPWEERIVTAKARDAVNWVFGPRSNAAVRAEVRNRFVERAAREGISQSTATAIWNRWAKLSHDSRRPSLRKNVYGVRRYEAGDNPLYADVWNLPNDMLDSAVHGDHTGQGVLMELLDAGEITTAERSVASTVNWAPIFRESTSFTRRQLADRGGSLGKALGDAYGLVAHNKAVTTMYYWFRFGLDVRYHAMNYLEAQILYMGRAGLRKGEIDEGLLGQTEGYLRKLDLDPSSNTGYVFSRDRMAWAYRTFLKEQPDALRKGLRTVVKEGPEGEALMGRAMRELAESDPQLRDMIEAMGATPEKYLDELDAWHRKMLNNIDETNDGATIDLALAKEMADTPALAEVFDRLGQVNRDLWSDIRSTFYGNPNRSRSERFLNSYLLFWPLSYQIKSTKWFAKVLFDRAGGIPTNALGGVVMDRMADTHNRLLATDPGYRDWFEKHDTLVFVAQMLFPVSFDQMGVSLNPALRGLFFERDVLRAGEIGPIYTYNRVLKPVRDELEVDLYPSIADFKASLGGP